MTEQGLVSVVVPVGSVDDGLRLQLEAILDQTTDRPFEVVLARNTTDPAAVAALDALVPPIGDHCVRIIAADDRRSASHARNRGAAEARGDVLAFCDADDRVHPGWLDALLDALDHHDAVGGHLVDVTANDHPTAVRPPATPGSLPTFLGVPYIVTASLALRRDHLEMVGGFDEDLVRCEDIALSWALLARGHRLGYAPEALVDYRHRPGLATFIRQHYLYGRGMSQVLARYPVPATPDATSGGWRRMVRANGQTGAARSWISVVRRGSVAAGRAVGLIDEARIRIARGR